MINDKENNYNSLKSKSGLKGTIILASASLGRANTLKSAKIKFEVCALELDEKAWVKNMQANSTESIETAQIVQGLAKAKGDVVVKHVEKTLKLSTDSPTILLAGDSLFDFNGVSLGKPANVQQCYEQLQQMSGKSGELFSGLYLYDFATKKEISTYSKTKVMIAKISEDEIEAYIDTGEPLKVAGGFTVDAIGGVFIEAIEGDYHTVVGLPLPLLRKCIKQLGYNIYDFWC